MIVFTLISENHHPTSFQRIVLFTPLDVRRNHTVFFEYLQMCENLGYRKKDFQRQAFAADLRKKAAGNSVNRKFAFSQNGEYFFLPERKLLPVHRGGSGQVGYGFAVSGVNDARGKRLDFPQ